MSQKILCKHIFSYEVKADGHLKKMPTGVKAFQNMSNLSISERPTRRTQSSVVVAKLNKSNPSHSIYWKTYWKPVAAFF